MGDRLYHYCGFVGVRVVDRNDTFGSTGSDHDDTSAGRLDVLPAGLVTQQYRRRSRADTALPTIESMERQFPTEFYGYFCDSSNRLVVPKNANH